MGGNVNVRTGINFTVTPAPGFSVEAWEIETDTITPGIPPAPPTTTTTTISMTGNLRTITQPATGDAMRVKVKLKVSYRATFFVETGVGGTISGTSDIESKNDVTGETTIFVDPSQNAMFTATPALGYRIKEWWIGERVNGVLIFGDGTTGAYGKQTTLTPPTTTPIPPSNLDNEYDVGIYDVSGAVDPVLTSADPRSRKWVAAVLGRTVVTTEIAVKVVFERTLDTISDTGIDYSADDVIVPSDEKPDDVFINLTKETITLGVGYTVKAYSVDGGAKWKKISSKPFDSAMFAKLLNKDLTLKLSDKEPEKSTKKPPTDAIIFTFAKIGKRPPALKLAINYEILQDITGNTLGTWVLAENKGTKAVRENVQIGAADSANKNKTVDGKGYGKFFDGGGIEVLPMSGNRAVRTAYFIRVAPKGDNVVYTAASKAKKITATSQLKEPKYKIDAKKNIIKVRKGTYVSKNGETPVLYRDKADISAASGDTFELWIAATAKKPASAKQTLKK